LYKARWRFNFLNAKGIIMTQDTAIKLFEGKGIRTHFDEQSEEWYFSVIDIVEALTDSSSPRDYWFKM